MIMKKTSDIPFYTRYNPPPQVSVEFKEPSLTQQQFKEEADINNIIASVNAQGTAGNPLWSGVRKPFYGDFAHIPTDDYLAAQELISTARENFMALPSETRKYFNNNPAELLAFIQSNPDNTKLVESGLALLPKNKIEEVTTEKVPAPSPEEGEK